MPNMGGINLLIARQEHALLPERRPAPSARGSHERGALLVRDDAGACIVGDRDRRLERAEKQERGRRGEHETHVEFP